MIKTITKETNPKEYGALETAAKILTALSSNGAYYTVEECYFDYGQDWKWTTVIGHKRDGTSWQAICPRDHDLITDIGTLEAIVKAVENTINDEYNPDRKRTVAA